MIDGIFLLSKSDDVSRYVTAVQKIADGNKEEFGFLPASAYEDKAQKGYLWVAADTSDGVAGYLLIGGAFPHLRITQLYVDPAWRRKGLASELVLKLVEYARGLQYQTICARVAADLLANSFYERQRFYVVRQVSGGVTTRRTINERMFEVEGTSLFSPAEGIQESQLLDEATVERGVPGPKLSDSVFVLDLNVLLDVVRKRDGAEQARRIVGHALAHRIRVLVSTEFSDELRRTSHDRSADPLLGLAEALPVLSEIRNDLKAGLAAEIEKIVFPALLPTHRTFPNSTADLRHLAECVFHRASAFVTREHAILRVASQLKVKFGLDVLSPSDLLA